MTINPVNIRLSTELFSPLKNRINNTINLNFKEGVIKI